MDLGMGNYGLKKMGQSLLKRGCLSKIRDCMNLSGSSKIKFLIVYLMVYLVVKAMGNYGIFVLL